MAITASGDYVSITGTVFIAPGQVITIQSGANVVIQSGVGVLVQSQSGALINVTGTVFLTSGQNVVIQSGTAVIVASGTGVLVQTQSGAFVLTQSASGEILRQSGQYVVISGQGITVITRSGDYVNVTGSLTATANVSGQPVTISGNFINIEPLSKVLTADMLSVTSNSGGVQISSGVISSVTVKAWYNNSGDIWVGGSTSPYMPFSGHGYVLTPSEAINIDVNNFNDVNVVSTVSGDRVTFIGAQQ